MKKKICFVLDQFLYGGIERVAINYLNGIDKNKYDIDVIILSNVEEMINQIPKECNIIKINVSRYSLIVVFCSLFISILNLIRSLSIS